jgi:hypothetical protein
MDDVTEHKIRDLRLRILKAEKEIAASKHNVNLGAWLGAGHASQMAKQGERDRQRLEAKLEELKAKLAELQPSDDAASARPSEEKSGAESAKKKKTAEAKPAAAKKKK